MNEIRNILLVGRTGQGKSSLANLLVNKNGNFEEVFKVGSGSISTTKNPQTETFREGNVVYQIIDTPSFSDTELVSGNSEEEEKIFYKLAQIASEIEGGINQILFVSDGRFTEEEVKVIGGLRSIVFDEKMAGYLTIVRTRFPEFEDPKKCKEDYESLTKEELINQNKIGSRLVKAIGEEKFIHIDNLPIRGSGETKELAIEVKKAARSKLLNHLMNAQTSYEPENLVKLKKKIKDSTDSIEKEKREVQRKIEEVQKKLKEQKNNEYTIQLRDLSSQSVKLEEEQKNNARSVAFNLFEENIKMITKTSEAGARIGKGALWGIGAPVGGLIGYTTGVSGALFNSGVSLIEEGVNFLTGNKEDRLKYQVTNLLGTNSLLRKQLDFESDRLKSAQETIANFQQQKTILIADYQKEKEDLQSQIDQFHREKSTLNQQVQDKDKKIDEQNQTIQNNQNEIKHLNLEKTRLNNTIDDLQGKLTSSQSQVDQLQRENNTLAQQNKDKEQQIEENQTKISELEQQVKTLQQRIQVLQGMLNNVPETEAKIQIPPQTGGGN